MSVDRGERRRSRRSRPRPRRPPAPWSRRRRPRRCRRRSAPGPARARARTAPGCSCMNPEWSGKSRSSAEYTADDAGHRARRRWCRSTRISACAIGDRTNARCEHAVDDRGCRCRCLRPAGASGSSTRRTGTPTSEPAPNGGCGHRCASCGSRTVERAADEHAREVAAELGRRVEVGRRLGAVAGGVGGVGRRRAAAQRAPRPRSARTGVEPMLTSATPGSSPPTAATPTIAQSCARRLNFSNAQPAPLVLRHPDLGDHLVGRERGLEEALEEVVGRDRALAAGPRARRSCRRARAPPRAGRTRGRRARASRRACRGGAPAGRRPRRRPRASSGTCSAQQRRCARRRGGG